MLLLEDTRKLEGRVTWVATVFVATPVKLNPVSVSTVKVTGFSSLVVTNKSKGSEQSFSVNPRKNSLAALSRTFPVEMKQYYTGIQFYYCINTGCKIFLSLSSSHNKIMISWHHSNHIFCWQSEKSILQYHEVLLYSKFYRLGGILK